MTHQDPDYSGVQLLMKSDVERIVRIGLDREVVSVAMYMPGHPLKNFENLRLVFDGLTGELKRAEVLKTPTISEGKTTPYAVYTVTKFTQPSEPFPD